MERLTTRRKDGRWALKNDDGATPSEQINKIPIAIDRLAAYEDTGMTPKQVRLISNVLQEVGETYNCWFDYVVNCVLENSHLKELAQAEKDGRLVVLPDRLKMLEHCPMRHPDNGNCVVIGGFCSPGTGICKALHTAYECGLHAEAEAALKKREADNERQRSI